MRQKFKTYGIFALRFTGSVMLLVWLFGRINRGGLWLTIKNTDKTYLAAAFMIFFVTCIIIICRWIILMEALDLKFKRINCVRWFFIGVFCNLFLPTSLGGDVVRALGLAKETNDRSKTLTSVMLDRITGFAGIILMAFVSFLFNPWIIKDYSLITCVLIMVIFFALLTSVIILNQRIFSSIHKALNHWPNLQEEMVKVYDGFLLIGSRRKELLTAVGLSIVSQIFFAYNFYLIACGMHQKIPLIYFIIFSPLVCFVDLLPSMGGLGTREIGWVYLLFKIGVLKEVAVGLSLINFSFMIIVRVTGGLWSILSLPSDSSVQVKEYRCRT